MSSFFRGSIRSCLRKLFSASSRKPASSVSAYSRYTSVQISPSLSFLCQPVCRQHSGSVDPLYRISLIHCSRMRMSSRIVYNLPKNCCRYHSPIPKHPNRIRNPPSICIPSVPFLLRSLCGQISVAGRIHPGALLRPSHPFHAEWPADRSRRPLLFVRPACPFPPPVHPVPPAFRQARPQGPRRSRSGCGCRPAMT